MCVCVTHDVDVTLDKKMHNDIVRQESLFTQTCARVRVCGLYKVWCMGW